MKKIFLICALVTVCFAADTVFVEGPVCIYKTQIVKGYFCTDTGNWNGITCVNIVPVLTDTLLKKPCK